MVKKDLSLIELLSKVVFELFSQAVEHILEIKSIDNIILSN